MSTEGVATAEAPAFPVAHDIDQQEKKKKEIYTYQAPWTVYSMAWRKRPEGRFQLAIGSFIEEYANQFHIVQLQRDEATDSNFLKLSSFDHPYPATKVAWAPSKLTGLSNGTVDLLATSGDYLRLWNMHEDYSIHMKGVLNNNKHTGIFHLYFDICTRRFVRWLYISFLTTRVAILNAPLPFFTLFFFCFCCCWMVDLSHGFTFFFFVKNTVRH